MKDLKTEYHWLEAECEVCEKMYLIFGNNERLLTNLNKKDLFSHVE